MNYKNFLATFQKSTVRRKTKFLVAALLLAASSAFAQVPTYVPTNGLVGWWPFNGNANDESGNGNNGTVNGATSTYDRLGNSNLAYSYDGVSSRINLSTSPSFSFATGDFTISHWYYSGSLSGNHRHSLRNIGGSKYFELSPENISNGLSSFGIHDGSSYYEAFANNILIDNNIWHLLTGVRQANTIYYYVDGVLQNTISIPSLTNLDNLNSLQAGSFNFDNGGLAVTHKIDDIGIWNRALTQQEITALYNSQTCNSSSNTIIADGSTTFCAGNSVNLKSDVVGGTYQWKRNGVNISTNATSRTFKASSTGSYICVATCNGTALTSNAIAVTSKTNASATVSASGATSFCAGDSVTLNATNLGSNYSVQWYRTNVSMDNATNYSQVVKQPGTYKVVTKNLTNGCSRISGSSAIVAVSCRIAGDITSGTPAPLTESEAKFTANDLSQGVNIFPNPNNGTFTFAYDGEEYGDAVLQVMNSMGQMIYTTNVNVNEGGYTQDLQLGDNSSQGIYIVRLIINGHSYDSRVLVR
jgi:hypothetical protein